MTNDQNADRSNVDPQEPPAGKDSRVEDWHGQSVQRDTELADELVDEMGEDAAEQEFNKRADGKETQEARRGSHIDPEQGESAYQDDPPN